ncbi:Fic family protein [archaeon]|nr:Fic family protein [archaeon]
MISAKGLIEINKKFDRGIVRNKGSLESALASMHNTKDPNKQLAYLIRAILIDHVFEEGNKRTAVAAIAYFFEAQRLAYNPYKVDKLVAEIVAKNINSIEQIRRKLKDAAR